MTATSIARRAHLRSAVAVLDTRTGAIYSAGAAHSHFATASVVKIMISAELLLTGQMHGHTAALAERMIRRSDDEAADVLWPLADGPDLEPDLAEHYDLDDLGAPNSIPGFWGNTQVTAAGLARLLADLKADKTVWPWLHDALAHTTRIASDGTNQRFGLLADNPHALVKQGWAVRSADRPGDSVIDSVGYVEHTRYVVVILSEGADHADAAGFDAHQAAVTSRMARALLP